MSLPNPNFQTGDLFTADNVNDIINAVLERLEPLGFDVVNQSGDITVFTYNVPSDKDQILTVNSYIDISVLGEGVSVFLSWTNMEGGSQSFNMNGFATLGGDLGVCCIVKALRGTSVTVTTQSTEGCVYSTGGSFAVVKSIT